MGIIEQFNFLPISEIADEVRISLAGCPRLVVTAPPGAGKSTLLPLALLDNLPDGKILMLEPRRIAARQVASRMATMLGEDVGLTVGYRVRFDTRISSSTRIEVITEGIMERMLIDDPTLEGVAIVIFDEFHERSLSSDLSLTLTREIQTILRQDLRILVMSATIDADSLADKMDAVHLHCPGKNHEVNIVYGEDFDFKDCAITVARAINKAYRKHDGNILAFLPGQAEILKCRELIAEKLENAEILTLYGMMPQSEQEKVLTPAIRGCRRVVLASPIAETSLTIDGISVVIDSGLYRTPKFEPTTGLSRLTTIRISLDMAIQRSGRAGRLTDGTCYRLWTKATESRMAESRQPEIESSDLSSMLLIIAAWGETDPLNLPWITFPPAGHLDNAVKLLRILEAIDVEGRLTDKGKRLVQLPCHPRIANMLTEAKDLKESACQIAALLEEKDPCHDETDADINTRIAILNKSSNRETSPLLKRIKNISAQYQKLIKAPHNNGIPTPEEIGRLVALCYPERIAMRSENGQYRLAQGGKKISLHPSDDLARYEFIAIASMGSRIFLAAPLDRDFVISKGDWMECTSWNSKEGRVVAKEELRIGQLTLAERQLKGDLRNKIAAVIASAAPKEGKSMFDFNEDVEGMQIRIAVAAAWHPELDLPDVSTTALLAAAKEWLPLYIGNATTVQELRKIDLRMVIQGLLTYEQQQALERITPTHISLPSGRKARIQYRRGADIPVVSARLQDCFGLKETPRIDNGKRPVLMELLSPGFKPVQLTQDMDGFWRNTYFEVRKELRRRYPKHSWPENPLSDDIEVV